MKSYFKKFIPGFLLKIKKEIFIKIDEDYNGQSDNYFIFSHIYKSKLWGNNNSQFYSGGGSHEIGLTEDYVNKVNNFLGNLEFQPVLVDLGCGDFEITRKLIKFCKKVIACDVVDELIEYNKSQYKFENVEFQIIDISIDELPAGDIVVIRQVLQHLSNKTIKKFVKSLKKNNYKYLIITEHLPKSRFFIPNINKITGPSIRPNKPFFKSGIILTTFPFCLKTKKSILLTETIDYIGRINTKIYQLN